MKIREVNEMARAVCRLPQDCGRDCIHSGECKARIYARRAIEAGYRKEREARWKGAGLGDYYCSLCQHTVSGRTKFCPECGAKMDDWEDEADGF